jgi:hypothetical protein
MTMHVEGVSEPKRAEVEGVPQSKGGTNIMFDTASHRDSA